jgi:hypothetical protein
MDSNTPKVVLQVKMNDHREQCDKTFSNTDGPQEETPAQPRKRRPRKANARVAGPEGYHFIIVTNSMF